MTLEDFVKKLDAYCEVIPGLKEQQIFNISIDSDAKIRVSLEESSISIPIT